MLNSLSQKLDESTINVFKYLDQIKKDNIVKKTISESNSQNSVISSAKPSVAKTFEHKSTSVHSTVSHQKTNVITSSKKDDDEWESF